MLEKQMKILKECNFKRLQQQFENEDIDKEILYFSKNNSLFEQNERRKFLNKRLENRKNLYIYPEQVNV